MRDTNRVIRPFEWGTSFITEHSNGDDPRRLFAEHTARVLSDSEEFFALPDITDFRLTHDLLTWTSGVHTPSSENNVAQARFFPAAPRPRRAGKRGVRRPANEDVEGVEERDGEETDKRAVIVLPQWNADAESHVALCRLLNRLGITALRLTLPYHEARRPPELERAEHLVSSNIGRTIQSMRQAVVDTRAACAWLGARGYRRIGIIGTSIGSCTAFLAFVHEPRINVSVFNHVSGYFADVVWQGISTQHVRASFGEEVSLEELRSFWLPISPLAYASRLRELAPRPMRFIAARYDLTFPRQLSLDCIAAIRQLGVPVDVAWLPCGHYTSGEPPWVYLDGYKIISYFRKHL